MYIKKLLLLNSRKFSKDSSKKLLEILSSMPRDTSPRVQAQQQQRLNKAAIKKGTSGRVYLQVLGSGAEGSCRSVFLFTDQRRYLFNCGEGTQRICHEHKVRMSRLEHVFVTRTAWDNVGGLPGVSLTLQDVGVPEITLHGPSGLRQLYHAMRRFVVLRDMRVNFASCESAVASRESPDASRESPDASRESPVTYQDDQLTVEYVLIRGKPTGTEGPQDNPGDTKLEEFAKDTTDYYDRRAPTSPQEIAESERDVGPIERDENCSVAYVCKLKGVPGKLDIEACVEAGVRPGPALGRLKAGEDVTLPDGRTVRAADVKSPDTPGPLFIVVEYPTIEQLEEATWSQYYGGDTPSGGAETPAPTLIVHFTPAEVGREARYVAWMRRFGRGTRHLVVNCAARCLGSVAPHALQARMHLLFPALFPRLGDTSLPLQPPPAPAARPHPDPDPDHRYRDQMVREQYEELMRMRKDEEAEMEKELVNCEDWGDIEVIRPRTLTIVNLLKAFKVDRSLEPKLDVHEIVTEVLGGEGVRDAIERLRAERAQAGPADESYPRIVFLGTGSGVPGKYRNTSAIMLHVDEDRNLLLDCGEGTLGQIIRFYGRRGARDQLRKLRGVYVSHLHADHHIGLLGVLQARAKLTDGPAWLLAPGQMLSWLRLYEERLQKISHLYQLLPLQSLVDEDCGGGVLSALGVSSVRTCRVPHCPNAFAVAVVTRAGAKLTYSGDTRPCHEIVQLGEGSDVLIHEATMEDELAHEARVKMHCTYSEAVRQGTLMRATHTILTHFSQRYSKVPRLTQPVGVAFDNLQVSFANAGVLSSTLGPLELVYAEERQLLDDRAERRQLKRARLEQRADS